jgi:hypothetical protein
MATTRPTMWRLTLLAALLAQLQPTLASFYTVTSYFALTESVSTYASTRSYTYTDTITLAPTVTPTASAISSRTRTDTYYDLEVVSVFVAASALASSDLAATTTPSRTSGVYTDYGVPVTWTAPSSCPTPFTVVTLSDVYIPYEVTPYITAASTATSVYEGQGTTYTWITYILDATQIPSSDRPNANPTSEYYYSYYVANCRNPTATGAAYWGPDSSGSGSGSGGDYSGGDEDYWDWTACSALTGCVTVRTWVIVVATILPTIFLLGFVESYIWFRRMMLGKSALRLGTVCWCCLSLWFILLTRKSQARSKEDQVLLKQYWATLGFGTRVKFWFKHGFAWRYPVELLGNPDGNNPVVVQQMPVGGVPPPAPGQQGDGAGGDAAEKMQGLVNAQQQQQPVYMPYPGQAYMQPMPGQPYPGQPYPGQPGFAPPPQGYVMMAVPPPQGVYPGQQPGFVPAQPVPEMGDGQQQQQQQPGEQQQYPAYIPSPSPVHTSTTEVPSVHTGATELPSAQPTPSPGPGQEQQPPPQPGQQPPPH